MEWSDLGGSPGDDSDSVRELTGRIEQALRSVVSERTLPDEASVTRARKSGPLAALCRRAVQLVATALAAIACGVPYRLTDWLPASGGRASSTRRPRSCSSA